MIKHALIVSALLVLTAGGAALADQEPAVPAKPNDAAKPNDDGMAACTAMMSGQEVATEGSAGMMDMARRMGGGDTANGMGQMMEMMGTKAPVD